jgi:hypothetical protein
VISSRPASPPTRNPHGRPRQFAPPVPQQSARSLLESRAHGNHRSPLDSTPAQATNAAARSIHHARANHPQSRPAHFHASSNSRQRTPRARFPGHHLRFRSIRSFFLNFASAHSPEKEIADRKFRPYAAVLPAERNFRPTSA